MVADDFDIISARLPGPARRRDRCSVRSQHDRLRPSLRRRSPDLENTEYETLHLPRR
jgi:hypothetical protein